MIAVASSHALEQTGAKSTTPSKGSSPADVSESLSCTLSSPDQQKQEKLMRVADVVDKVRLVKVKLFSDAAFLI